MIPIPGMMGVPVKPAEEAVPAEEPETEQAQKPDEEGETTPPAAAPEHAEEGESISIQRFILNLVIRPVNALLQPFRSIGHRRLFLTKSFRRPLFP
jgi:hypothetical protein